jgi:hypothetical protein
LIAAIPFGLSPRKQERRSKRATHHGRAGDGRNDATRFELAEAWSACAIDLCQVPNASVAAAPSPPAPESAQPDIAIALQAVSRCQRGRRDIADVTMSDTLL